MIRAGIAAFSSACYIAKVSGFEAAFQGKTNVPVERLNPLARMLPSTRFDPDWLEDLAPTLGVGVGLAMRRMDEQ